MIFVKGEWSFYAMRFLLGLAEAGFFPGVIFNLTLWYPSKLRAPRTAWFVAAIAVSGVVGNPISGWIMDKLSGAMNLAGWQWSVPFGGDSLGYRRDLGDLLFRQQH